MSGREPAVGERKPTTESPGGLVPVDQENRRDYPRTEWLRFCQRLPDGSMQVIASKTWLRVPGGWRELSEDEAKDVEHRQATWARPDAQLP